MITNTDIAKYFYNKCKRFSVPTYMPWTLPKGDLPDERITIVVHDIAEGGAFWDRCIVEVNWMLTDIDGCANVGLDDVERRMVSLYKGNGIIDGTTFKYEKMSATTLEDKDFNSHYHNLKILFNIQRVNNYGNTDFCD